MPYQIRSPYGWEDQPPGAVMDEDTLSRLLQLGLVRALVVRLAARA